MQIVLLIMLGVIVSGFAIRNVAEKPAPALRFQETVRILKALKSGLGDPSSLQIEEVLRFADGTHCITFRARNEADITELGYAIGEQAKSIVSSGDDTPEWERRCGGGNGIDVTNARRSLN